MRSFFNADNWLWKPLGWLGELVILSLFWTVFSVPILTLGPASAALYDAAVHGLRRGDDALITRFLKTFRRELKEGVLSTLVWMAIALALAFALRAAARYIPFCGEHWPLLLMLGLTLAFFLLCVLCWVWPLLSRFAMEPAALHAAAVKLAFGHILRSAAMALLWGGALYAGVRYVAPLFVCPGLAALLSSYLIEPVFRAYEEREP